MRKEENTIIHTTYIAEDGKVFYEEQECLEYERLLAKKEKEEQEVQILEDRLNARRIESLDNIFPFLMLEGRYDEEYTDWYRVDSVEEAQDTLECWEAVNECNISSDYDSRVENLKSYPTIIAISTTFEDGYVYTLDIVLRDIKQFTDIIDEALQ